MLRVREIQTKATFWQHARKGPCKQGWLCWNPGQRAPSTREHVLRHTADCSNKCREKVVSAGAPQRSQGSDQRMAPNERSVVVSRPPSGCSELALAGAPSCHSLPAPQHRCCEQESQSAPRFSLHSCTFGDDSRSTQAVAILRRGLEASGLCSPHRCGDLRLAETEHKQQIELQSNWVSLALISSPIAIFQSI